jgi:hypothetical protein
MKTQRLVEIVLFAFILLFASRAFPNLNVLQIDSPEIGDQFWGRYTRMEFMATHPAGTPTFKPAQPQKYWFQRPRIYLA